MRPRVAVCTAATGFDPSTLDRAGAVAALREWSAIRNAADAAVALAAARIEVCGPPPVAGARDAAEFVSRHTGTSSSKAKEQIAHGHRLVSCSTARVAAAGGVLSGEQATAITDAAAVNPAAEAALVMEASRSSLGGLREACAQRKADAVDLEELERRVHARRCVRRWRDAEGAEHLHATGSKRDMALVDQALKPLVNEVFTQAPDGRHPRAVGGVHLRRPRDHGDPVDGGNIRAPLPGQPDPAAVGTPTRSHRLGARTDRTWRDLRDRWSRPHLGGAARDLLGESTLHLVLTTGIAVRNVTHLGHGPTAAQRIALLWEQPVCRRQSCGRRARLEYDHAHGYEYRLTGHTRIDELDLLCDPDHELKSLHGWALVEGTGVRPMVHPDDPRHPRHTRRSDPAGPAP